MKRFLDILVSFCGLLFLSPILVSFMVLIWLQDFRSPFYIAPRALRRGATFRMVKLRSMVANADKMGGSSTSATDTRVTWVGRGIRKYKLDEFMQLWNVLKGDMSLVGPRPQVPCDVETYTDEEFRLLEVPPGITDFSSIVFADEGEILCGSENPDLKYNQLIRPWKSRLGLFYVDNRRFSVDVKLIALTVVAIISRRTALRAVQRLLRKLGADEQLIGVSGRTDPLQPHLPPGNTVRSGPCASGTR